MSGRQRSCQPWHHNVLPCLTLLQQTANHLGLLLPRFQRHKVCKSEFYSKMSDCKALLAGVRLPSVVTDDGSAFLTLSSSAACGKMRVLRRLLAVWSEERAKVLLFSSSCALLDIIERAMIGEGRSYLRMDGTTPPASRLALVDTFNASEDVRLFLISTTAGGVGLNLTSANIVVVFDPNWNPGASHFSPSL
jgi:SNF2 family DNA or RNA helicase